MSTAPLISHPDLPPGGRAAARQPAVVPSRPVAAPAPEKRDPATSWPLFVLVAIPALVSAWGVPYYLATDAERLRHPLHSLLKSSGPVGLSFGVVALALFLFMWLYPLRRKVRWLSWTGPLGTWMDVHIVMGLAVPGIAAVHAGWRFEGLIGLGYGAMVVVSLSGVVGRYLYTHIPRSRTGLELSLEEVGGERRALLTHLAVATGLTPQEAERSLALDPRPYAELGLVRTFLRLATDDWTRWRTLRRLAREWSRGRGGAPPLDGEQLHAALRLARREMSLTQQVRMLEATRKVFAWWHVAHRPFAMTALLAVIIHVVVAVWVGGVRIGVYGGP